MKQRNNRTLIIAALVIALASTTVAYAVLQTNLNITGTITKTGGTWGQEFQNLKCDAFGKSSVSASVTQGTGLEFNGNLAIVGDIISCTFDLVNTGSLKAQTTSGALSLTSNNVSAAVIENLTVVDDGYTKCWLSKDNVPYSESEHMIPTRLIGNGNIPFNDLDVGESVTNLGLTCQYYNLFPDESSSTDVKLYLVYEQA